MAAVTGNRKCEPCGLEFGAMTKLISHMENIHGRKMICEECGKKFAKVRGYVSHVKNHGKEKRFACDVCGFATAAKSSLAKHRLVRHRVGKFPFGCKSCGKGFANRHALNDHEAKHTGERRHQCHKCGSAYASVKSLDGHCRRIHPEMYGSDLMRCGSCGRGFKSSKKLEEHETAKHGSDARNVCEFCGKDFSFRESLVRHRRIHTGEKPNECSVCRKRFSCATYLKSHARTHTGEKPYRCRFCWKRFTQRSSLVTHERSHLKGLETEAANE